MHVLKQARAIHIVDMSMLEYMKKQFKQFYFGLQHVQWIVNVALTYGSNKHKTVYNCLYLLANQKNHCTTNIKINLTRIIITANRDSKTKIKFEICCAFKYTCIQN